MGGETACYICLILSVHSTCLEWFAMCSSGSKVRLGWPYSIESLYVLGVTRGCIQGPCYSIEGSFEGVCVTTVILATGVSNPRSDLTVVAHFRGIAGIAGRIPRGSDLLIYAIKTHFWPCQHRLKC